MNELKQSLPFPQEEIDRANYTASLLILCSMYDIINKDILLKIKNDLDKAFIETAEQFTKRESSTIPQKTAEHLYESLLFQCDAALLQLESDYQAIDMLKNTNIDSILECGKNIILSIHEDSKRIFQIAYKNKLPFPIFAYQYVMNKAFDEYCTGYSARFNAKNAIAAIDYPLLGKPAYSLKSQGAFFIHEYYTAIMYENLFCKCFDEKQIEKLLISYGKQNHVTYADMLFNISEVILNNLLANSLLNKDGLVLVFSEYDCELLEQKFKYLSIEKLSEKIINSLSNIENYIKDIDCCAYLKAYIPQFTRELYERIKVHNSLMNYLIILA